MNNRTALKSALLGLLMGITPVFSTIPGTVWHTNDTSFFNMWNKTNLDTSYFWPHASNWGVKYPGTDSAMITTDGLAQTAPGWNNLVWKWQTNPVQKNFEIQFSYHMVANPNGNSGFNARGHCGSGSVANLCGGAAEGYKVFGPQIDLGPTYTGDVWNSGNNRYATAISACKLTGTLWQDLGYRVSNDTAYMLYYPNGFAVKTTMKECSKYKFTEATDVAQTSPGLIAIQYETTLKLEFKNIKMRNLDAIQQVVGTNQVHSSAYSTVSGGLHAVSFSVPKAGKFSVKVTGIDGRILKTMNGIGPVANFEIPLGQSGLYIVTLSNAKESYVRKVYAL